MTIVKSPTIFSQCFHSVFKWLKAINSSRAKMTTSFSFCVARDTQNATAEVTKISRTAIKSIFVTSITDKEHNKS